MNHRQPIGLPFFMAMTICELVHIPPRLHTDGKPVLPEFYVNELLYRRCKPEQVENPFGNVSLYDLSLNRQGEVDTPLCEPTDALFVVDAQSNSLLYEEDVIALRVKEIDKLANTYLKKFSEKYEDTTVEVTITLIHDPLPCNYSHSMLVFKYSGVPVTKNNYKTTLGKKNKPTGEIRDRCRFAIAAMLEKRELWINSAN